jgi:flagella basal body P-ring formation protein FlgA
MNGRKSIRSQEYNSPKIFVTCTFVISVLFCHASANNATCNIQEECGLKVYLPREVTVKDSRLSLGRISIIRGKSSLVAKANKIALGQISVPGQSVVIDRPTVLSRLACNGIPASKVTMTGAKEITVKQQQRIVSGSEFVYLASSFLKNHPLGASVCQWDAIGKPKALVIPGVSEEMKLFPRRIRSSVKNQARVEINVFYGGKKIGVREVVFRLKYHFRQAVAKVDIAAGEVISPENVKIEIKQSDSPEPAGWQLPYGLITKRPLAADTVLRPYIAGPIQPPTVVKRNQSVVIRIEKPGFLITAIGKTMQDGKAGECIKVRNVDSQRIILARINEDGSVEPIF